MIEFLWGKLQPRGHQPPLFGLGPYARSIKPRAIIAVDLFGQPADYPAISAIAKKHNLKLVADQAQGFGCTLNGKQPIEWADVATTSFFPAKPLGCYGDGGAMITNDDALAGLVDSIRVHGKASAEDMAAKKYDNDPRYGYGYDYSRYGNSRGAVSQCVSAVERGTSRYGRTDVTQVTSIDRKRDGYRVKGRVVVTDGYGGRWGRGGYYDKGKFSCDVRYGRVQDVRLSGLR